MLDCLDTMVTGFTAYHLRGSTRAAFILSIVPTRSAPNFRLRTRRPAPGVQRASRLPTAGPSRRVRAASPHLRFHSPVVTVLR